MDSTKEVLTSQQVARILGRGQATIEYGLRVGSLPFGVAFPIEGGRWKYIIPKKRFYAWLNGDDLSNIKHKEVV
jgi:hypothetical protein